MTMVYLCMLYSILDNHHFNTPALFYFFFKSRSMHYSLRNQCQCLTMLKKVEKKILDLPCIQISNKSEWGLIWAEERPPSSGTLCGITYSWNQPEPLWWHTVEQWWWRGPYDEAAGVCLTDKVVNHCYNLHPTGVTAKRDFFFNNRELNMIFRYPLYRFNIMYGCKLVQN